MMPKLLSHDLRLRVVRAIDAGLSCRQAAARFDVAPSTAIRRYEGWPAPARAVPSPKAATGGPMSPRLTPSGSLRSWRRPAISRGRS